MSKKMMIAVMAGTISLLAGHLASARGGGGHGGMHAMLGAAVGATSPGAVARSSTGSSTGAAGTSSGNGAQTARPNTNRVPLGNSVAPPASSPTTPSNAGASRAGGGTSPPNNGLNNLAINPNDRGLSGTLASPPHAGTNAAGTALSVGLPTGQTAKGGRTNEDVVLDREAAKIDRLVKSICAGC